MIQVFNKKEENNVNSIFFENCINSCIMNCNEIQQHFERLSELEQVQDKYEVDLLLKKVPNSKNLNFCDFMVLISQTLFSSNVQEIYNPGLVIKEDDIIIFETYLDYEKAKRESNYYDKIPKIKENLDSCGNIFIVFTYNNEFKSDSALFNVGRRNNNFALMYVSKEELLFQCLQMKKINHENLLNVSNNIIEINDFLLPYSSEVKYSLNLVL
jgi:hypothetical protein